MFPPMANTHGCWQAGSGPAKDLYNIGENPQFALDVSSDSTSVWVLLTRHIVDKQDFAQNREFITLVVYKGTEKVYLPFDPAPYIDGVRINSPHYLCKINIPEGGATKFVLVISQYEKTTTIYYTIRVYSPVLFTFKRLNESYQYVEKITNGSWDESTAGGCPNFPLTYKLNPVYLLDVKGANEATNDLLIDLKEPMTSTSDGIRVENDEGIKPIVTD
ncbi:calpain-7-like [Panonychus citri]|uniref:calpain-7-like n=1 Tax=Panonychus citri TaxID=50023 RepID=UPI002307CCCC|nr:calpain-7-like [Panonychus citri]